MKANLSSPKTLPILITAVGGGGHGEQILKALCLAKNRNYYIIGADADPDCPQFKLVNERISLPLANSSIYMQSLLKACDHFQIKALFHGCEPELKQFSLHRNLIMEKDIFLPINSSSVIDMCMDKETTSRKLSSLGFDPPKFIRVESKEDLKNIDWFPVVVKPSVGGGGSSNVFIAQNVTELLGLADYLGLEAVVNTFLIQEYVGKPEDEYTVGILHDLDGDYLNAIAVKRQLSGQLNICMSVSNRTLRTELGDKLVISSGVSHGYVDRFPEVTEQCKEITKAIGARGPINIQCRYVDGKVKVFEINPRFSGTTSIRAMAGFNEPDILIRKHIYNEDIKVDFEYESGLVLRGLVEYKIRDRFTN
jgi:carbamoyl-phosphate synthase large subunit